MASHTGRPALPRAFIVSLAASSDRRARVTEQLSAAGIDFEFVDAIDGRDEEAVRRSYVCDTSADERFYVGRDVPISTFELACSLSHLRAVRRAYEGDLDRAFIVEDDVIALDGEGELLAQVLRLLPPGAAYVQFALTPAALITTLSSVYRQTGQIFLKKTRRPPTGFADDRFAQFGCHCAAAYLMTRAGLAQVCDRSFTSDRLVKFPCADEEVASNVGLVADRLIFWAAAGAQYPGYACAIPLFATEAAASLLHGDHVHWHKEARKAAEGEYALISNRQGGPHGYLR
jgi:GR25 family glycosyltransferase involved in LPS biosynthesis